MRLEQEICLNNIMLSPFRILNLKIHTLASYVVVLGALFGIGITAHNFLSTSEIVLSYIDLSLLILLEVVFGVTASASIGFYLYFRSLRKNLNAIKSLSPDTKIILKEFLKDPSMTMNVGPNHKGAAVELQKAGIIRQFEYTSSPYTYKIHSWVWKFLKKHSNKEYF